MLFSECELSGPLVREKHFRYWKIKSIRSQTHIIDLKGEKNKLFFVNDTNWCAPEVNYAVGHWHTILILKRQLMNIFPLLISLQFNSDEVDEKKIEMEKNCIKFSSNYYNWSTWLVSADKLMQFASFAFSSSSSVNLLK